MLSMSPRRCRSKSKFRHYHWRSRFRVHSPMPRRRRYTSSEARSPHCERMNFISRHGSSFSAEYRWRYIIAEAKSRCRPRQTRCCFRCVSTCPAIAIWRAASCSASGWRHNIMKTGMSALSCRSVATRQPSKAQIFGCGSSLAPTLAALKIYAMADVAAIHKACRNGR